MMIRTDRLRRRRRGIALVLVLWVIALLTVIALGLTTTQRTESALTRNQIDGARFRAMADAGINLVALNLLSTPLDMVAREEVWVPDGLPRPVLFEGERLEISIFNEGSRVDLNRATREQLLALIDLAWDPETYDQAKADRLADAILDWRDEDDMTQLNGAEDPDYEAEGLAYGAADMPFRSVEELRQVLGMPPDLFRRLAPHLTVDNPSGGIDEQFASAVVLSAVRNLPIEDAQALVEERNQPTVPGAEQSRVFDRGGPLYRIRVTQTRGNTARRTMEALISLEPGGVPPFELRWRRFGIGER
jgi:general secretion pathway protein K